VPTSWGPTYCDRSVDASVHFSRKTDEWATPQEVFNRLDSEFHFELDVAATAENTKCEQFYSIENSGLRNPWAARNWCNPPYSEIKEWVTAAWRNQVAGNLTVMLIPARTDTRWFHDLIYNKPRTEIRFLKGRLKFGNMKKDAPFPSMVVIFRPFT
jgi:phage N-6-adenine-methyltransferase